MKTMYIMRISENPQGMHKGRRKGTCRRGKGRKLNFSLFLDVNFTLSSFQRFDTSIEFHLLLKIIQRILSRGETKIYGWFLTYGLYESPCYR